ncbi:toxic anion resistance protein [Mesobacillus thioparans]|uniref:toxic anion resistance protein n=1 Tax=Mesobacillus thioparans TaxID=370439 RepID=UPI0039EDF929
MNPINDQKVSSSSHQSTGQLDDGRIANLKMALRSEQEVQHLTRSIDEKNLIQILDFGMEPAIEVSHYADQILGFILRENEVDSANIFKRLGSIMARFDKRDFEKTEGGLFSRIFQKSVKRLDVLINKYQTIGKEIDQIYVEISKYTSEMAEISKMLELVHEQYYQYYLTLEKYIVAGEIKLNEWKANELLMMERPSYNENQMEKMELDIMNQAIKALEQRVHELESVKMVVLQAAHQIKMLQSGNARMVKRINSGFISAIPIFKEGLHQSIAAKKQKLVADSLKELARRTNGWNIRKAQNIIGQNREIEPVLNTPGPKIETIEACHHVILEGIQETISIEEENKRLKEKSKERLLKLQKIITTSDKSNQ